MVHAPAGASSGTRVSIGSVLSDEVPARRLFASLCFPHHSRTARQQHDYVHTALRICLSLSRLHLSSSTIFTLVNHRDSFNMSNDSDVAAEDDATRLLSLQDDVANLRIALTASDDGRVMFRQISFYHH
jgi:hypothetical protein